jgi:hypothetical protein
MVIVAGWLSDPGIRLVLMGVLLVGVLLEVICLCIFAYGESEWDRLLWDAGLGRSNSKNNHFWNIRTITHINFSFLRRTVHLMKVVDSITVDSITSVLTFTYLPDLQCLTGFRVGIHSTTDPCRSPAYRKAQPFQDPQHCPLRSYHGASSHWTTPRSQENYAS